MIEDDKREDVVDECEEELWDANPNCKHKIINASGGGVKCIKYGGWFCFWDCIVYKIKEDKMAYKLAVKIDTK